MLEALFFTFSHPGTIIGRDGAGDLLLMAAGIVLITVAFMALAARHLMRRSLTVAVVLGATILPLLMNVLAFLLAWNASMGTDGGGMLVFATLVLSICALPITLATSILYVLVVRRTAASAADATGEAGILRGGRPP